jgi:hypothetical protein
MLEADLVFMATHGRNQLPVLGRRQIAPGRRRPGGLLRPERVDNAVEVPPVSPATAAR